jgi:hypothetical protein
MYSMFILRSSFFFFSAKRLIIAHNFSLVVTVPCRAGVGKLYEYSHSSECNRRDPNT